MKPRPAVDQRLFNPPCLAGRVLARVAPTLALALWLCGSAASGQDAAKTATVAKPDISTRYRFIEQYDTGNGPPPAGTLGTYRLAFKNTNKVSEERTSGAPSTTQTSLQMIYTERAAAVAALDSQMVTDVIRHYETVRMTPQPPAENKTKPYIPLEGMTLLVRPHPGSAPDVLTLTPDRPMRVVDFMYASTQIWVPNLVYLLPNTNLSASPKKVGETWPVVRNAASTLVGFGVQTGQLKAKLEDVAANAKGDEWTAIISIAGQAQDGQNEAAVNARVVFTFAPPEAPRTVEGAAGEGRPENVVDARGAITEIRLASVNTQPSGDDTRLRISNRREFVLQRQIRYDGPPLDVPNPAPKPNEENSWLTYVDPGGEFQLSYPQELMYDPETSNENLLVLLNQRPEGVKIVKVYVMGPKHKFQPEATSKDLVKDLEKQKFELNRGHDGWLPEAEWPGMKIYHFEAAATDVNDKRFDVNKYWVHMGQSPWFAVESTTTLDPPGPFRKEVETIIKGIKLTPKR